MTSSTSKIAILKKSQAPKLTAPDDLTLTYHVGYVASDKSFHIRVTANTTGGFFSNEWIALDSILEYSHPSEPSEPFKAIAYQKLYQSKGANNHGFLAAALRAEGILAPVENHPLSHTVNDPDSFKAAMTKLIKAKTSLHDDVAEAQQLKDEKRAQLIANMEKTRKAKAAAQGTPTK